MQLLFECGATRAERKEINGCGMPPLSQKLKHPACTGLVAYEKAAARLPACHKTSAAVSPPYVPHAYKPSETKEPPTIHFGTHDLDSVRVDRASGSGKIRRMNQAASRGPPQWLH